MATKLETTVYDAQGKESGKVSLPESVFGAAWNANLVHGVANALLSNARSGTAHTKDRSEVRGGGRKPWRQKGTGRARHGSRRSPIWTGGGVTFGPLKSKDYSQKVNKNVRAKALAATLSKKFTDMEVIFLNNVSFEAPKTKEAGEIIGALGKVEGFENIAAKDKNAALVVLPERNEMIEKSFRNIKEVHVTQAKDASLIDLLTYKYVVVVEPEKTLPVLEKRVAVKSARKVEVKK